MVLHCNGRMDWGLHTRRLSTHSASRYDRGARPITSSVAHRDDAWHLYGCQQPVAHQGDLFLGHQGWRVPDTLQLHEPRSGFTP